MRMATPGTRTGTCIFDSGKNELLPVLVPVVAVLIVHLNP